MRKGKAWAVSGGHRRLRQEAPQREHPSGRVSANDRDLPPALGRNLIPYHLIVLGNLDFDLIPSRKTGASPPGKSRGQRHAEQSDLD